MVMIAEQRSCVDTSPPAGSASQMLPTYLSDISHDLSQLHRYVLTSWLAVICRATLCICMRLSGLCRPSG